MPTSHSPAFTPDHRFTSDSIASATDEQLTYWGHVADDSAFGIGYCDKAAWTEAANRVRDERIARAYPR